MAMTQAAVGSSNRIPPHNHDAEQSVLGAMLESREAIANVIEILDADDFYKPAHGEIYETVMTLYGRGEGADAITVAEELARRGKLDFIGGRAYILGLIESYPTASSARHYAKIVDEHATLRRLIEAGNQVQELGFSLPEDVPQAVDQAEELIYGVGDRRLRDDIKHIRPLLTQTMIDIEKLYERGEAITGVSAGFPDLDEMTSGFQDSNLIILAARPAMGKSSLLNDFALNAAMRRGIPAVIFSLEMSRGEIVKRFLASEAKVDAQKLNKGTLQEADWTRLSAALGRLAETPIFIDDSANITLMEMRAKCRRLKAKHGLGLVIIDYLQLMQSPRRSENRQQEVSEISRSLKILAKELQLPVICASQLNRGVEYRADKRPFLGDLRESGCLTGDTRVSLASGRAVPIRDLVGQNPEVLTLDGWQLGSATATKVWKTGTRAVLKVKTASGRTIRATSNHPFLMFEGWKPAGDLKVGDRIGIARSVPAPSSPPQWPEEKIVLLAHLIGDGSFLKNLPLRYASQSEENLDALAHAALHFGVTARCKWEEAARSFQMFLPAPYPLARGRRNPIVAWLDELGIYNKRSHQKFVPAEVAELGNDQIALFLKHLWATDGCVFLRKPGTTGAPARIYYATNSERLATDVQMLLARLDIFSSIKMSQKGDYRPGYSVIVQGSTDQLRFAHVVGGFGTRAEPIERVIELFASTKPNPNNDTIPVDVWTKVKSRMNDLGITQRKMQAMRGVTYGGTSHFKFAPSRALLAEYAGFLNDVELKEIATSDLYWDAIVSIEQFGVEDVYDMTVPGTHNFLANGVVVHNSIEQDADVVMFIYRDEVYNPDTEHKGEAELILAKHRNGPTGTVRLAFMNQYTKFASIARGPGR
ncbi:MAG: replicative helicase [Actinomycetota bacterium]|nr:replicative helicase [Actinomycetota bacterium]